MDTRTSRKAGLPPGTLVHVGAASKEPLLLRAMRYGRDTVEEFEPASPEEAAALTAPDRILWIDFCGVHHVEALARLGERFGVHPLVMEDVANTAQRPKAEAAGDHLYVVVRDLRFDAAARGMASEQVSIVLGRGVVLTFRERPGDLFDAVRERIRRGAGRIRAMGADYLAHALLDVVVDRYFLATEALSEELDLLEEEVLATGGLAATRRMHELRRAILTLRRAAWPLGKPSPPSRWTRPGSSPPRRSPTSATSTTIWRASSTRWTTSGKSSPPPTTSTSPA